MCMFVCSGWFVDKLDVDIGTVLHICSLGLLLLFLGHQRGAG